MEKLIKAGKRFLYAYNYIHKLNDFDQKWLKRYLKSCFKAFKILKTINSLQNNTQIINDQNILDYYEELGDIFSNCLYFSIGIKYYNKQLTLAETIYTNDFEHKDIFAPIYRSLALTYKDANKIQDAIIYYNLYIETFDLNKKDNELAMIYVSLGKLYIKIGIDEKAIENFKNAKECAEIVEIPALVAYCLTKLIKLERVNKDYTNAVIHESLLNELKEKYTFEFIENYINEISESSQNTQNAEFESDSSGQFIMEELFDYFDLSKSNDLLNVEINDNKNIKAKEINTNDKNVSEKIECLNKDYFIDDLNARLKKRRQKSVNVFKKNELGETLLHQSCIKGDYEKCISLIQNGSDVNTRDYSGWTPIHEASNHGFTSILMLLIENGANVNDSGGQYCGGITPLMDAVQNKQKECVEILLKHGADPFKKDANKKTAIDYLDDEDSEISLLLNNAMLENKYKNKNIELEFESDNIDLRLNSDLNEKKQNKYLKNTKHENFIDILSNASESIHNFIGSNIDSTLNSICKKGPRRLKPGENPLISKDVVQVSSKDSVVNDDYMSYDNKDSVNFNTKNLKLVNLNKSTNFSKLIKSKQIKSKFVDLKGDLHGLSKNFNVKDDVIEENRVNFDLKKPKLSKSNDNLQILNKDIIIDENLNFDDIKNDVSVSLSVNRLIEDKKELNKKNLNEHKTKKIAIFKETEKNELSCGITDITNDKLRLNIIVEENKFYMSILKEKILTYTINDLIKEIKKRYEKKFSKKIEIGVETIDGAMIEEEEIVSNICVDNDTLRARIKGNRIETLEEIYEELYDEIINSTESVKIKLKELLLEIKNKIVIDFGNLVNIKITNKVSPLKLLEFFIKLMIKYTKQNNDIKLNKIIIKNIFVNKLIMQNLADLVLILNSKLQMLIISSIYELENDSFLAFFLKFQIQNVNIYQFDKLHTLKLEFINLFMVDNNTFTTFLSFFKNLKNLNLNFCNFQYFKNNNIDINKNTFSNITPIINKLEFLKNIQISGINSQIIDGSLICNLFPWNLNYEKLNLSNNTKITNLTLNFVNFLKISKCSIKELILANTCITGFFYYLFTYNTELNYFFQNLIYLDLSNCNLDDRDFQSILQYLLELSFLIYF